MPAAYDNYDYPSYWKGREYEHQSEFLALKKLVAKIPKVNKIIEIGTGFGRLLPSYQFRSKKIVLTDPSAKLISIARKKYSKFKNIEFIQTKLQNIPNLIKSKSFDLAIMVRVLHHIEDIDEAFAIISKLISNRGYFILEFPNKSHLKACIRSISKGDFTYPINIFPIDIRSKKHIKKNTLPFINYHPDQIIEKLKEYNFEILEVRSVSNIRSTLLKKLFSVHMLIDLERILQIPFAKFNFGPSFFVLARKRDDL
ncbi:MAG: class I SAM-dependent methyltransferase [Candidatus Woesebacteria bacterium]|nr:class I SAM-dependent methyltransferase [Candidatus Woesebacteria bacterium]